MKLVHLVGFITKKFVTMHGHVDLKYLYMFVHIMYYLFMQASVCLYVGLICND